MRFIRPAVLAVFLVGIAIATLSGWSSASQPSGQVGYGVQQVPDQVIDVHKASSSHAGLWIGILVAVLLLGVAVFVGWRRTRSEYV